MKRASRKAAKTARDGHEQGLLALAETFPASDPPAMLEPAIRPQRNPESPRKKPRAR